MQSLSFIFFLRTKKVNSILKIHENKQYFNN